MKTKRALITGIAGQDGSYLAELLLEKGYEVYGIARLPNDGARTKVKNFLLPPEVNIIFGDIRDLSLIRKALELSNPDEIFNLAGQSSVGASFQKPEETMETNYYSFGRLVEEVFRRNPKARVYQASSSEMFGNAREYPQKETTLFMPESPYAVSKVKAYNDHVVNYRKNHDAYICSGILFNHESPRRGEQFVTRKVTRSMAGIFLGTQKTLSLGNINVTRDFGYAKEYVEAMWLMLQQEKPEDFIIATGKLHSIKDIVNASAGSLGMELFWSGEGGLEVAKNEKGEVVVNIDSNFYRPSEISNTVGDASLAKEKLGWEPKMSFEELISLMTHDDLILLKNSSQ